jgi:hypothetical protein
MAQPTDTSAIQRLIRRARVRIRTQWAFEGATTATVVAAATALASVFAVRTRAVSPEAGIYLLIASGALIVVGAVIAASRRLDDERVARTIDRASGLSDRLSTAIAFSRGLTSDEDVTHEMMVLAIHDGVRAVPRANIRAATPFAPPRDWRAALGFLAVSALAAGLSLPTKDHTPHLTRAVPDHAPPGAEVVIEGDNLLEGIAAPMAAYGAPTVFVPTGASVYLGTVANSRPVQIENWTRTAISIVIPAKAALGDQKLIVFVGGTQLGAVDFTVVDPKDERYHKDTAVALDPDEKAYVESILAELKNVAQRDKVPELDDFAKKIEQLLSQAENGEITKEQLMDALSKAEDALNKENEPNPEEVAKQLSDMGKELQKDQLTKDLGDALQKQDLEKAQQELEKLADKLDKKELSEQQKQELAKKLDEVAKQMEQKDQKDQQKTSEQQQKLEKEIRRLEQQKDQAKNDQQKQDLERRLEDKKRELEKLQKDEQQKQQSDQRRAVKRLQKDMEKAAENLQKPDKKPGEQDDKEQDGQQQASQKLRDAARETGRVDQDRRKQATQKKMSSQMDDLREALRRAKQHGNKGPNDPFNKQGKNQDFISRARGQKGRGQAWKPGQGQKGQGQGQGQDGQDPGDGQQPGGDKWGTEHDDNLTGDPTAKSGNDKDQELQGVSGNKGGSTRETILSAAQKGFASVGYKKVYADYQRIVEEVMRTEKLPSSYKYYVKRYFAKIHPSTSDEGK